jgi:alpha-L-rhamnosidase
VNGATSLGENWNGPLAGPHSSLNHFMLGYVDTWLVQTAGVAQTAGSAAWTKIDYKPLVVRSLTYAKSSYRTVRGIASGSWSKSGTLFTYDIQVPVGATGTVYLPGTTNVKEGGAAVSGRSGVTSVTVSGDTTVVGVQSGSYSFTVG